MNKRMWRTIAMVGTTVVLAGGSLTGCGGGAPAAQTSGSAGSQLEARDNAHLPADWDKVVAAAQKEGQVLWYTTLPAEQSAAMAQGFNKAYPGIKVQIVSDATTSLANRYEQERKSSGGQSPGDIVHSVSFEPMEVANPDWFTNLAQDKSFLPSLADFDSRAVGKSQRSVLVAAYQSQVVVNTQQVTGGDVPTSAKDLTDPKYKGKLLLADPRSLQHFLGLYLELSRVYGPDYLPGLAKNAPTFLPDVGNVAQQVAAGQRAIGFSVNAGRTLALEKAKAPIQRVQAKDAIIGGTTMAFPTNAPHPNAARVFGNWLLTAQGQEVGCTAQAVGSMNALAKGDCSKLQIPADAHIQQFTVTAQENAEVLKGLGLG